MLGTFNRSAEEDPLKAFDFIVEIDGFARFGFTKVGGLKKNVGEVKIREGNERRTERKSPGLATYENIALSRGVYVNAGAGGNDIYDWVTQVDNVTARVPGSSATFRRTVEIVQVDKEGTPRKRWRVIEAWVSAYDATGDFDAMSEQASMESMTLTHEGFQPI